MVQYPRTLESTETLLWEPRIVQQPAAWLRLKKYRSAVACNSCWHVNKLTWSEQNEWFLTEFKTQQYAHQTYSGDEIKEDQVGTAYGGEETVMQDVGREPWKKHHNEMNYIYIYIYIYKTLRISRHRQEDNIKINLREVVLEGVKQLYLTWDWTSCISFWTRTEPLGSIQWEEFLGYQTVSISRSILLHAIRFFKTVDML